MEQLLSMGHVCVLCPAYDGLIVLCVGVAMSSNKMRYVMSPK